MILLSLDLAQRFLFVVLVLCPLLTLVAWAMFHDAGGSTMLEQWSHGNRKQAIK